MYVIIKTHFLKIVKKKKKNTLWTIFICLCLFIAEKEREREREREQSRVCLNYPKFERNPSAFLLLSQPYPRKNTFVYYTEKEFL